jgi:endonuclease G
MITIDELERRTGIDFFCNLPDDIEKQVESTSRTIILEDWNF